MNCGWVGLVILTLCAVTAALADTVRIPVGQQGATLADLPARGDSRTQVLDRFGLPDQEHPPVGRPAIRRWDYRAFSVYFENDRVLDAVRDPRPAAP